MDQAATIASLRDQLHVSDPWAAQASPESFEDTMDKVVWDSLSPARRARIDAVCSYYDYTRDYVMWEVACHQVNLLYADIPEFLR